MIRGDADAKVVIFQGYLVLTAMSFAQFVLCPVCNSFSINALARLSGVRSIASPPDF